MKLLIEEANTLRKKLEGLSAIEVIRLILSDYNQQVTFASSLGAEDQVLIDLIAKVNKPINVFTLDTGRIFQETYSLLSKTISKYNIPINIFFPDALKIEEMVNSKGINLFYESIENRKLCCKIRKIEPLTRAISGYKIWFSGLRREQSITRNNITICDFDAANNIIKVSPLLDWTDKQIWEYIKSNGVPYNVLHDKDFPSIGCQPCTRPVAKGEDIRSGRWWWENPEQKECGLHSN